MPSNRPGYAKDYYRKKGLRSYFKKYQRDKRVRAAGRPPGAGCELCGSEFVEDGTQSQVPHYDHCHRTDKFRGWLCHTCNLGLGYFKDDPDILRLAIQYLSRK